MPNKTKRTRGSVPVEEAPSEKLSRSTVAQGAPSSRPVFLETCQLLEHYPAALGYGHRSSARTLTPPLSQAKGAVSNKMRGVFKGDLNGSGGGQISMSVNHDETTVVRARR